MPLELFLDLYSPPCRAVYLFAKINNIPFEVRKIDLFAGDQYGEEFGKISVLRKIPVMRDGDFILTESVAILKYMAQKFSLLDHWYPASLQKCACVNEYLSWQCIGLHTPAAKISWFRCMTPILTGAEVPKEKMDSAMEELTLSLNFLEEKFLQDRPFIVGDQISLADLIAIVELMQPVGTGVDVFKDRPRLSSWRERVKQELGETLFVEAHDAILKVSSLSKTLKDTSKLEFLRPKLEKRFL